jgi:hypothetical protein
MPVAYRAIGPAANIGQIATADLPETATDINSTTGSAALNLPRLSLIEGISGREDWAGRNPAGVFGAGVVRGIRS